MRRNLGHIDPKAVARVAMALAPRKFISDLRARLIDNGVAAAVRTHDTAALFAWMTTLVRLQGTSDRAADSFASTRAPITLRDVGAEIEAGPACQRLRSYWHLSGCAYRKRVHTCAEPRFLPTCPLPKLDVRKGSLNVAAYSLALFFRDITNNDPVGWLDARLERADHLGDGANRARRLRDAVVLPFAEITGIGNKIASMVLADLLIGGDPTRERWVTAGGRMTAIDSLVHNTLARTGIIDARGLRHTMGAACYQPGGCADVIEQLAAELSSEDNATVLPRELQHAIWFFASEGGWAACNGRRINDQRGCDQRWCPASHTCRRLPLR